MASDGRSFWDRLVSLFGGGSEPPKAPPVAPPKSSPPQADAAPDRPQTIAPPTPDAPTVGGAPSAPQAPGSSDGAPSVSGAPDPSEPTVGGAPSQPAPPAVDPAAERPSINEPPVSSAPIAPVAPSMDPDPVRPAPSVTAVQDPIAEAPIPSGLNIGLSSANNDMMIQLLGMPRDRIDTRLRFDPKEPLRSMIVTEDVGPFRVTGLNLAVASLRRVFAKVRDAEPVVYASLKSNGMLAIRRARGASSISNHSWGTAVDLIVGGVSDGIPGTPEAHDGKTLAGLVAIAPFFNAEGWFWGVAFRRFEDGMHFEVSAEKLLEWRDSGALGDAISRRRVNPRSVSFGDVGQAVREVQQALFKLGYDIMVDGDFGAITRGVVMDFQSANGLEPDGIVGPKTREALGIPENALTS